MAEAGQHKASVTIDGRLDGLDKASRGASQRIEQLERQIAKLSSQASEASTKLDRFDAALEESRRKAEDAKNSIGGPGLVSKLADLSHVGRAAFDVLRTGAQVISDLAERSRVTTDVLGNLPYNLSKAQAATGGLVDEMTLATAASTLNSTKVATNARDFAELAGAAQKLGARIGLDAKGSLESLSAALARGSTEMLDNLGIVLKQEQAHAEYAASMGKTVDALTDAEKAEAFRVVAMRKIIEAAKGIKLDTDSASAAVKRFENDLDRLANRALGGEQAQIGLKRGLGQVAFQFRETGREVGKYGRDADELRDLLEDLNVSTEELGISNADLGRELDKVRKAELTRIEGIIFAGEATAEHIEQLKFLRGVLDRNALVGQEAVDQAIERQEAEALAARQARQNLEGQLTTIQQSIAFMEGLGEDQALLNEALQEEARLRAEILDLEGKSEEAARVRADAELARVRQSGEAARRRTGGGGRRRENFDLDQVFGNTEAALARMAAQEERALVLLERTGAGAQKRWDELTKRIEAGERAMADLQDLLASLDETATPDPFSLDAYAATRERQREIDEVHAELRLEQQLRAIEEQRAMGVDPLQLLEQEAQARLAMIDVQERAANDQLEILELTNDREALLHDLKLARLAEEREARERNLQAMMATAQMTGTALLELGQAAAQAAILEGSSVRAAVAARAKQRAFQFAFVEAPSELLLAGIAAASFNAPLAALHLRNAGRAIALAGVLGGVAGAAGGFGGAASVAGGFGGAAFGSGGGGGRGPSLGGGVGGSSSAGGGSSSQIPVSPAPPAQAAPSTQAAGRPLQVIIQGDVIGVPRKEFFAGVSRGLRDLAYERRVG